MSFAIPEGMSLVDVAAVLVEHNVITFDLLKERVEKMAESAITRGDISQLKAAESTGWHFAGEVDHNKTMFGLSIEHMLASRIPDEIKIGMFRYLIERYHTNMNLHLLSAAIGESNLTLDLIKVIKGQEIELDQEFVTRMLYSVLSANIVRKKFRTIDHVNYAAQKIQSLFDLGVSPTSQFASSMIVVYFDVYHRKWKGTQEERYAYINFINSVLERDDLFMGYESLDLLKKLASLSHLSRRSKTKIRALMLATEMVGNKNGDD